MKFEDLTASQIEAISISLDVPADQTLGDYLEEKGTDLTVKDTQDPHSFEVRTDDQGGEMTGWLVYEAGAWMMRWDGWYWDC